MVRMEFESRSCVFQTCQGVLEGCGTDVWMAQPGPCSGKVKTERAGLRRNCGSPFPMLVLQAQAETRHLLALRGHEVRTVSVSLGYRV